MEVESKELLCMELVCTTNIVYSVHKKNMAQGTELITIFFLKIATTV